MEILVFAVFVGFAGGFTVLALGKANYALLSPVWLCISLQECFRAWNSSQSIAKFYSTYPLPHRRNSTRIDGINRAFHRR